MSLLDVRDLSVFFRTSSPPVSVVSHLEFSIGKSEIFGLAGESGCGKSITALSVMGILPPSAFSEGKILFRETDLLSLDGESMRKIRGKDISMIFQEPMTSLNPVLTVGYQIAEVLMTHEGFSKGAAMTRAAELLDSVRIPSAEIRAREYPHQMSGGMRQRAMIAMAIACNPSLLIADEPTTALDVTIQAQILSLLHNLRDERGMSILLITHDLAILAENASRIGIMYAGRLMETGNTAEVFRNPLHPYTLGLMGSLPKEKGVPLNPIPGFVPSPGERAAGCTFAGRCKYVKDECRLSEPELRELGAGHFARCLRAEDFL